MVGRWACGLDQEYIFAPHVFLNLDERLAIGERLDGGLAEGDANVGADFFC